MKKIIGTINMTLDGIGDHTAVSPDEEIHDHYTALINSADKLLYGRTTYQLMESYWPLIVNQPTGEKSMDEFAVAIDNVNKIVFSRTLKTVDWRNTTLKNDIIPEEITALKSTGDDNGKDIYVGSPGLINTFLQLNLIDELQLCVHPVVAGKGTPLFKNIEAPMLLKLIKTKSFGSGAVILYYESAKQDLDLLD
jgi:dihydrofolate reductase